MNQTLSQIDLEQVDPDAIKVIRRLHRFGHQAYLVGGCVRDLLLERTPKDFDIATSATPTEIRKTFRNCRIIGRRFKLAHIYFGKKIIETSTFRAQPPQNPNHLGETEIIRRDNIFGTAEEDARRRDFTINGLFHDIKNNQVIDHVGGLEDLKARRMRTIGDPYVRIKEDPVRIIRAVKFASRLNFNIDEETHEAMIELRGTLAQCSVARVLEEIYRLLGSGNAKPAFQLMHQTGVLAALFPEIQAVLAPPENPIARTLIPVIRDPSRSQPQPQKQLNLQPDEQPNDNPLSKNSYKKVPSEEELATYWDSVEWLLDLLLGKDPQVRDHAARLTWCYLEALDNAVVSSEEPLSHALLLSFVLLGLSSHQLSREQPLSKAIFRLEKMIKAVAARLRISRKDRERMMQIICAQRRMIHRSRRTRPSSIIRRDYFSEAWLLFEASSKVSGQFEDDIARWQHVMSRSKRSRKRRKKKRR